MGLCTGRWAVRAVAALERIGRAQPDHYLWAMENGKTWNMAYFWSTHVLPRLQQLQRERHGGLEDDDLKSYGGNSFRRSWNTWAGTHPEPVSSDLRERQGRWRFKQRRRNRVAQGMVGLYFDPPEAELLRATIHMGSGQVRDWSSDREQRTYVLYQQAARL